MKIKSNDYAIIKDAIARVIKDHPDAMQAYINKNLSPMRFRWDCLYTSNLSIGNGKGTQGQVNVYAYADDSHIDTALRYIMLDFGLVWASKK